MADNGKPDGPNGTPKLVLAGKAPSSDGGATGLGPSAKVVPAPHVTQEQLEGEQKATAEVADVVSGPVAAGNQAFATTFAPLPNTPTIQHTRDLEAEDFVRIKFLTAFDRYNAGEIAGFRRQTVQRLLDMGIAVEAKEGEETDLSPSAAQDRTRIHTGPPTAVSADSEPNTTKPISPGVAVAAVLRKTAETPNQG